jgi:hypothetical protein
VRRHRLAGRPENHEIRWLELDEVDAVVNRSAFHSPLMLRAACCAARAACLGAEQDRVATAVDVAETLPDLAGELVDHRVLVRDGFVYGVLEADSDVAAALADLPRQILQRYGVEPSKPVDAVLPQETSVASRIGTTIANFARTGCSMLSSWML